MVLGIIILLFILKFNSQAAYTDYLLSLSVCLGIASLAVIIYQMRKLRLEVKYEDKRYYEGDDITLRFTVDEPYFHTAMEPVIEISLLQEKGEILRYRPLIRGDEKEYVINNLKAGTVNIVIGRVNIYGLLGGFKLPVKYGNVHKFNVYPKPEETDPNKLGRVIVHGQGEIRNAKGDDYSELYEVRPMVEGDDLRYIHKTLTVKNDEYIMKVGSDSQMTFYIYNLEEGDFSYIRHQLSQIRKLSEEVINKEGFAFSVNWNDTYRGMGSQEDLYAFIDEIYEKHILKEDKRVSQ